ncbi:hypothetical protein BHE90_013495 [Fusarium euwallaceae]|uniref:Aminotransferase class I/classII large domain-containing protein n=1 Tax=Fusarium euwallaceae TaxID=1147111 RepID=A0A430L8P3_9HYPO|nr:hypothetical protein BHE90_013495 [Fusarium euwallaceae]
MAPSASIDTTAAAAAAAQAAATLKSLPHPKDLSHHYSQVTKNRVQSRIKAFYRFIQTPGISNFSGGMPNVKYFPYDTLEADVATPERWQPSPNTPAEVQQQLDEASFNGQSNGKTNGKAYGSKNGNAPQDPDYKGTTAHITIPKVLHEPDRTKKIDLATALQYGLAAGYPPLLSFVKQFTNEVLHPSVPYHGGADVILNNGGTDGFSKVLQLLVDPWYEGVHPVTERPGMLCETFVFGNVLTQSRPLGVQVVPVELDREGMLVEGPGGLRDVLDNWDPRNGRRPHFLYTVTMGHNPTSGVLGIKRRKEIYALASKYDIIIVEDDPYWYLQFPSAAVHEARLRGLETPRHIETYTPVKTSGYEFIDSLVPSYLSIDVDGRVIRLDTFSKTVAPGCRLGYVTAQPAIIERITRITEASTSQPSGFVQAFIAQVLLGPHSSALAEFSALPESEKANFKGWKLDGWVRWLAGLRGEYERRMTRMCTILEDNAFQLKQSTPDKPDSDWDVITKTKLFEFDWPRGGMFVWLRIHFEQHPLFNARGTDIPVINGSELAKAFLIHSTQAPNLVLGSPGGMFSATPEILAEHGWKYVRLCFAAESDENVDAGSLRFSKSVQNFFRITEVAEIEKLIAEL